MKRAFLKNKSSLATTKRSFINSSDTFVIRRCLATIKRIRQLLITINYITIHENNRDHLHFFEFFLQYNLEALKLLIDKLEKYQFSKKSIQLIKAIYGMATELFNIDIFSEIQHINLFSLQGLDDKSSGQPKENHSKFSNYDKKIILIEDELLIDSKNDEGRYRSKLKTTKVFTEPKLNFQAKIKKSELYMQHFYKKGGFSSYNSYDDLIDDILIDVSDSDSDLEELNLFKKDFEELKQNQNRKFTFSQRPSDLFKKLNLNEYGIEKYVEQKNEIQQKYSMIRKQSSGVNHDIAGKELQLSKFHPLKNINESPEVSGDFDEAPVLMGIDLDESNTEVAQDDDYFKHEENEFEEYGFNDPFFK